MGALPARPRDWEEDFEHENGKHICECRVCGTLFIGHKRRVTCGECALLPEGAP